MHLSYTAMTGKPVANDVVLRSIVAGRDLTVFANIGAFEQHHLRVLVTMGNTPLYVVKMVAREANTNPASVIDYCSSAAMARVLINICHDATCFSLYDQDVFRVGGNSLHDDRKGADSFRRKHVVYEVLCERIRFGGDVLPSHVAAWFNICGTGVHEAYMLKHGSPHMRACYDIYQEKKRDAGKAVVPYEFMVGYHRYTKYLPVTMYVRGLVRKEKEDKEIAEYMSRQGYGHEQVAKSLERAASVRMMDLKYSTDGKKKQRRFARAVKSVEVRKLLLLTRDIFRLEGCFREMVLSFL